MAIYYNILYPPLLPLTHPAFEATKPSDTFRIYFEPSVGNKISDFKGGFIRIRSSETEKSVLLPLNDGYPDDFLPFRNPFAEYTDLVDPSKSYYQPPGYNQTMPEVSKDSNNQYYIDIKQEVFLKYGAPLDTRYKLQIMLTTDWVNSTLDNGRGFIQTYDADSRAYVRIDKRQYFGGNLVSKGLSEWSTNSLIAPVSEAKYELQLDGENIFSPIFEFVGSSVEETIRNNTLANYLKAYRINIYRAFGKEKELFIDSSGWIIGQEASNLEIRWQNVVELENKNNYIIELDIQTAWDLRKTFTYHVTTTFEDSLFKGSVSVENDHDYARAKIKLNIQTPLQWGPRDNFDISILDREFVQVKGEASILEGIDLFSSKGTISGEMIVTGIKPIKTWEEREDRWFFRLSGPALSNINPVQEEYLLYAYSIPIGRDKVNDGPYEETIIINPVIESTSGSIFKTYLDSNGSFTNGSKGVVTYPSDLPSSHTFFYLEDEQGYMWRTTLTIEGEFITERSHQKDPTEFLKPVAFHDPRTNTLAVPTITTSGEISLVDKVYGNYVIGENVQPMYINEFRLVKKIYALELGRKTLISEQKYKAFMTDFGRKLGDWAAITEYRQYYLHFSSEAGQIRLVVKDLSATDQENRLDRFTSTYSEGISLLGSNSEMFLLTTGVAPDFTAVRNESGRELPYVLSPSEEGVLFAENGYSSVSGVTSRELTESDVEEMRNKGEIE